VEQRTLGSTEVKVSRLGWGTVKLGRTQGLKYPTRFALPDDEQAIDIVHRMLDLGITLIDTAPAYGIAEAKLGLSVQQRRDDIVLATKVGELYDTSTATSTYDFSPTSARTSLQHSLELLRTSHVDMLFVHSDGNDLANQNDDLVAELIALRDEGLTRAIGFSGKTIEGHEAALTWADVLMVHYGPHDRSHESLIRQASDAGVGVVLKKALDSGQYDAAEALQFCWHKSPVADAIASVIVGSLQPANMQRNLAGL
jgi:aryl-alcohol dehydrogenase-like predicted oxidoreductase